MVTGRYSMSSPGQRGPVRGCEVQRTELRPKGCCLGKCRLEGRRQVRTPHWSSGSLENPPVRLP